ncbi:asparaginase [Legionella hackeliae]|uniref:L-asparaginase II n=1 Tax=Legionella hackeliae TaxID=449 RepID=A0A0A8UR65_LEGHA|nr:asparaginase [Legionella hackeliae]KTD12948.1 L-asparaginase I [Legionella hackeliae]CEK09259.1 L-asparaginase II [Legionella hackeliae]STX49166.1 L-asparaginase I [Legionella hackeliae]
MKNNLKTIGVIELGGTINCISVDPISEFYKGPKGSLSSFIERLKIGEDVTLIIEKFSQLISHEITIKILIELADRIQFLLDKNKFDGIVVTAGTNALEDIAYFIGLVVKSIKPIVFTGANYPQNSLSFDGERNLLNAISIASSNYARKLGVLVTFNDHVVTARDATKNAPGLISSFAVDGVGVIGHVIGGQFVLKSKPLYRHTYQSELSIRGQNSLPKVSIIYAHLGMDESLIEASIVSGVSGIVSAGFGKGYQSTQISLALNKAVQSGIPVVRCSRSGCSYTNIDRAHEEKYGFIVAKGLSPHKSSLLLSLALIMTRSIERIQQVFEEY